LSDDDPKKVTEVFSTSATLEIIEELQRKYGPDPTFMLQRAHRPFHDPYKVYRIELADPTLRIASPSSPRQIDRNKLH